MTPLSNHSWPYEYKYIIQSAASHDIWSKQEIVHFTVVSQFEWLICMIVSFHQYYIVLRRNLQLYPFSQTSFIDFSRQQHVFVHLCHLKGETSSTLQLLSSNIQYSNISVYLTWYHPGIGYFGEERDLQTVPYHQGETSATISTALQFLLLLFALLLLWRSFPVEAVNMQKN